MLFKLVNFLSSGILWFALHIENKSVFPKPLTSAQEAELFRQYRQGDKGAKDKLISHNLRLVAHIVKKYSSKQDVQDELISIGTIGLIKAVTTFDSEKGNRFAAYGSRCIENEILMHYRNAKKASREVYFDDPIDTDKDGNKLTLIDIIPSDEDICEEVDKRIAFERLSVGIARALDDREREIINLRYGISGGKPLTQREVATLLGISRSYVSRIEKKAIEKLSHEMTQLPN